MAIKRVVLLVGGVGGAKLAYGLKELLRPDQLDVVVNTGDDFWLYGLRICPDLDTIVYTLSGLVDRVNGWGIMHDSMRTLQALQRFGEDTWFRLGDLDIATHLLRTEMLRNGQTLTQVIARLTTQLNIEHRVLPMTDHEVATLVDTVEHGQLGFQQYFVRHRWQPTVSAIHYSGAEQATLSPQVAEAIQTADAIIIGPSNPWLSVAPILAVNGMRGALLARDVPRVAVTPIIGGQAIKGPTAKIMHELNIPPSSEQVAAFYGDIINGFVYDQQDAAPSIAGLRVLSAQTLMRTDHDKIALAKTVLGWLEAWGSS